MKKGQETIYVYHELGNTSHYIALEALLKKNDIRIKYRAFNYFTQIKHIIKAPTIKNFTTLFKNFFFLFQLYFFKNKKIVIGIAPYNSFLKFFLKISSKNKIYYHTSFNSWNGIDYVYKPKREGILKNWNDFIKSKSIHIFAVSNLTKQEIIKNNLAPDIKISVVNHSYKKLIEPSKSFKKEPKFVFVGSLNENKGILQLLEYFSKNSEYQFTIVGSGELSSKVKEYSETYKNIHYKGYIKDFKKLEEIYKQNCFLVSNSLYIELFGMSIIESMACGCIPICTKQSGPCEIITDGVDGLLAEVGNIDVGIKKAVSLNEEDFKKMKKESIKTGQKYHCDIVANNWKAILN